MKIHISRAEAMSLINDEDAPALCSGETIGVRYGTNLVVDSQDRFQLSGSAESISQVMEDLGR